MIKRTERDIFRAYSVYKAHDIIKACICDGEDASIYTLICAFVALYNGITLSELQIVLPVSKSTIKDMVRKAVYTYGILDFDGSVVIGHRGFLNKGGKGVISISHPVMSAINDRTKTMKVSRRMLRAFAAVLSNSSTHTIIMEENIENIDSKSVLKHMYALWLALLSGNLYSGSEFAKNLSRIGYMRESGGNVIVNKEAVFLKTNKEPNFELQPVCKNN